VTFSLRDHLHRAAQEFNPGSDQNWVEAALPVERNFPFPGYTAETIAAGICTEKYLSHRELFSEILPVLSRTEAAIGRSYAGRLLIEIAQNTEDAYRDVDRSGALHVSARVRGDGRTWVSFEHGGKPFDAADVDGFRLQRSSTKPAKRRRIGRFGVGIKAVLSIADAIELHSGGFHLRFEAEGDWPVFACPQPLQPQDGPAVRMVLRWCEAVTPEKALAQLVVGFDESELVFLERLRAVQVGDASFELESRDADGPFATFADRKGRTFRRLGDPEEAAVALVSRAGQAGGEVVAPVETFLHAYFRVTKCSVRIGFLAHAPFVLSEDRESLDLASPVHRNTNLELLTRVADLGREMVRALPATGVGLADLPNVVLGPADGLGETIASVQAGAKAHGNPLVTRSPDDVLRARLTAAVAKEALFPTEAGALAPGPRLLFGQKLQPLWNAAFPESRALPTGATAKWLASAPRAEFGIADAGSERFARELDAIDAEPAVGPVRPLERDDGPTGARLRLLVALQAQGQPMQTLSSIPHPVLGRARGKVFLPEGPHAFHAEDLERLGIAVLDTHPWAELRPEERNTVGFWFAQRGLPKLDPLTVMREVDRLRRASREEAVDGSLLRIAATVLAGAGGRPALASAWSLLFATRHRWNSMDVSNWSNVWRARVRCPCHDGAWRPFGDLSLSTTLKRELQVDLDRLAAILATTPEGAAQVAAGMGASKKVPLRIRFMLPLRDSWDDELAEFRREVPEESWNPQAAGEHSRALFGFARGERKVLYLDHPHQRFPVNDQGENHKYVAGGPGRDLASLVVLADAALPESAGPELARAVVLEQEWLSFVSAPLFNRPLNLDKRAGPRGAYPSRLLHQLRASPFVRTAADNGGRAGDDGLASPRELVRAEELPKDQWASSAKAFLPLVAKEDLEELQPALETLGIVSIAATRDLRHLLRALFLLVARAPQDSNAVGKRRPYRAAWRELIGHIGDLVLPQTRRGRQLRLDAIDEARASLTRAMADAAYLGWIPSDASTPERFPVLMSSPHDGWITAGECAKAVATDCVFFLGDGLRADGYEHVRFADLGENPVALARVLRIPAFRPRPGVYEAVQDEDGGGRAYLGRLIVELLPAIRAVVTTRAPGGGFPMGHDLFNERVNSSRLREPQILAVAAWPQETLLEEPAGGKVPRAAVVAPAFLFERLRDGPVLLADRRCVTDPDSVHANLWRLDQALANALESPGHAEAIQNILRVAAGTSPGEPVAERAARIRELLGRDSVADEPGQPSSPPTPGSGPDADGAVWSDFYRAVFHYADARAAALLLATPTSQDALANASLPWHETIVGRYVIGAAAPAPEELARTRFNEEAPLDALSSPLSYREWLLVLASDRVDFDDIRRRLEKGTRFRFRGRLFESVEDAEQQLAEAVDQLPVTGGQFAHPVVGVSSGRDVRGGGGTAHFAATGSITGVLGERYARRWLAESGGRRPFRIVDVSTRPARQAASYPPQYGRPDPDYSPGCDILVFVSEGDALPLGYEVKSRMGDGPLRFEMTRREREACEQVATGKRDSRWPLAGYHVLAISNLLAPDRAPSIALLEATPCLAGSEATGFTVRAEVGGKGSV
jgi:hypothetical protein